MDIINVNINSFGYGKKNVIENVRLNIRQGEFVVLTGLSGCGKTTLLRLINGLAPSYFEGTLDGEIKLLNKNINAYQKGELAKYIGNVFQNPKDQFFSTLAEDEVALVGENFGMPRDELRSRVTDAFDKMHNSHLKSKSVFEMSGGQRQSVAITSTLVYNTEIIFFDEPSASLDYKSIEELTHVLAELKSSGKTIVIAEHRLYYLKELIDRLIVMRDGTVIKELGGNELTDDNRRLYNLRCFNELDLKSECDATTGDTTININDVDVQIRGQLLAKSVGFDLKQNECMAVIGKNGIGKTTLGKQICGLLPIKKGAVSIGKSKRGRLSHTGYVLQDASSQIFSHTVEHELIPKGKLKDSAYLEHVKKYLKAFELWDKRHMHPQELSVGETQRLAIITSFLKEAEVIILDEPTAGLDYHRMNITAHAIKEKIKQTPVILITHDTELLLKACNTVLLLDESCSIKINVKGNEEKIMRFMKE